MFVGLHQSTISKVVSFLCPSERIALGRVCRLFQNLLLSETFWPKLCINDRQEHYNELLQWCFCHIDSINANTIEFTLFNCSAKQHKRVIQFFKKCMPSLTELSLWIMGMDQDKQFLLLNTAFETQKHIETLHTTIFVEDKAITQKMGTLRKLYIVGQDVCFSGVCLERLPNLQALVIKPHDLDFGLLTKYVERSGKELQQLQIDCENFPPQLFIRMMKALNPSALAKLRLYHLENLNGQCFITLSKVANLQQLCITKAYQISNDIYSEVFGKTRWPYLTTLDISESVYIEDQPLIQLVNKSPNLSSIKLAWCTKLSCKVIGYIVQQCKNIGELVVTGVKQLNDNAFSEYQLLLEHFNRDKFLDLRQAMKESAKATISDVSELFGGQAALLEEVHTLRQLRLLDCVSCDSVSTEILEVISVLSPTAIVLDYYSNRIGLHLPDPFFD